MSGGKVSYLEFHGRSGRMLYLHLNEDGREVVIRTVVPDHTEQTICDAIKRCAERARGVPA